VGRVLTTLAVALTAVALAGCGGGDEAPAGAEARGEQVFAEAGCGDCHTLAAAGANGSTGPNLDELRLSADRVERQVRSGGGGMPSFESELDAAEIGALADYVASASHGAHMKPSDAFEPNRVTVADCEKQLDGSCYEQAFGNLAYERGPAVALDEFEAAIRDNPVVESRCHPIAHTIGAGGLLHFDSDLGRAFAAGTAACGSGYYHGLLEWKLAAAPPGSVAAVARTVCADERIVARPFTQYQCVHGLGHGLMLYTKYDLPGALDLCHELPVERDQVSCTGGVFMENQQTSYGAKSKWLKDDDLLYPCTIVETADKLYCYLLVTSHILPHVGSDWGETARWCRKAESGFVEYCFQSMGRDASGYARQEPVKIHRFCAAAGDMRHECLFGAARDILNNDSGDLRSRRLCESSPASARSYCFYGIGSILGIVQPGEAGLAAGCARFAAAGRDREDCLSGGRSTGQP
jgi:mono/diheme cytochrome c family protein